MKIFRYFVMGLFFLYVQTAAAGVDPISWSISSGSIPANTSIGTIYLVQYTFKSNFPFTMPTSLNVSTQSSSTSEFLFGDSCSNTKLGPGGTCNVSVSFSPKSSGSKTASLTLSYGGSTVTLPQIQTTVAPSFGGRASNWTGIIGVDYNPNHYVSGSTLNSHDVFYANTANGSAITNTYAEMSQLKAAGYQVIRSYQTLEYAWIDIINQANALGLKVVYEASIPQNGSSADITNAVNVLNNVITAVGTNTFNNTVMLVLAGHENYSNTDINYLTSAVNQLQAATIVPVSSALVSGDIVTPGSVGDMTALINSYTPSAPIGFDPYPFQWGVSPYDQAATNPTLTNSIAWDYANVQMQSFYQNSRTILMAESGWATQGTGQYANYFCYIQGDCAPGIANAATYLTALYSFVNTLSNNSAALVFEAYDEPAKDAGNPNDAENHYGVFDQDCNLKNNNTSLLPATSYSTNTNNGCQGFAMGTTFSVVGTQAGATTNQPPFTVQVTQTNPETSQTASYTATVPNADRTNTNINPWPQYLVYNGASVTITGQTSGASCTVPITVNNAVITFGALTCTNPSYLITCSGSNCFLPGNNF